MCNPVQIRLIQFIYRHEYKENHFQDSSCWNSCAAKQASLVEPSSAEVDPAAGPGSSSTKAKATPTIGTGSSSTKVNMDGFSWFF